MTWDTTIKWTDVAIGFATLAGPVLAVQAQKWVERATEKRRRRRWIFETLMANRASPIAQSRVEALNLLPLAFHGRGGREIVEAWNVYFDHLNNAPPSISEAWTSKSLDLFTELLHKMSLFLGYDFKLVEIKRGCYFPRGHEQIDLELEGIRRGLLAVLKGEKPLPMEVRAWPPTDEKAAAAGAEAQKELQTLARDWLSGKSAPRMRLDVSTQEGILEEQIKPMVEAEFQRAKQKK
jgi:hypothetical protein